MSGPLEVFEVSDVFLQKHYTPKELADKWRYSTDKILEWFKNEPGVLKSQPRCFGRKRQRVEIRIPEGVAKRVYEERTK